MSDTVLCIGNAIVDILARVEDDFIERHNLVKGSMALVDELKSAAIYADMPPATERSGGSAGNTAAAIAMLGGRAAYIGKVRDDQLGRVFQHDMRASGVSYETEVAGSGLATATSMVLVTPDAERTMNTYLGACVGLTVKDIDEAVVASSAITYVEGYLWDTPSMKAAVTHAMTLARNAGGKVSVSLSDSFCVDRFRGEFRELVKDRIDILFANSDEIRSLYETDDLEEALGILGREVELAAITLGDKGAIILSANDRIHVGTPEVNVVDTTGAGDLFAAGFLYGLANDYTLKQAGQLGVRAAGVVIGQLGARPEEQEMKKILDYV